MFRKLIVGILIFVLLLGRLMVSRPGIASVITPVDPTPNRQIAVEPQGVEVKESPRLKELNRVLGIDMAELQKLSQEEVQKLYEVNADKLGVQVYRIEKDSTGKDVDVKVAGGSVFKAPDAPTKVPTPTAVPTVAPTVDPYPAPSEGKDVGMLVLNRKIYMPIIDKYIDPQVGEIQTKMAATKGFIDRLFQADATQGWIKEYPGCPLAIRNAQYPSDYRSYRNVGHYYETNLTPVGKVTWFTLGYDYDFSDVTFEMGYDWGFSEPDLGCDVNYGFNGDIVYTITKFGWQGTPSNYAVLVLGDTMVWSNTYAVGPGTYWQVTYPNMAMKPAHRFTVRHAATLGNMFYTYYTDPYKYQRLAGLINQYGFNSLPDIYAPMFGLGTEAADDYMFSSAAYHDCDLVNKGLQSTIATGINPHRYPYESKVCLSRTAYILLSEQDFLATALQAIHILNKYGDPDHLYLDPRGVPGSYTTPREIARWIEDTGWIGYGVYAYQKNQTYASGLRTQTFLALESILGFVYDDPTSEIYANAAYDVLRQIQWGTSPNPLYTGETGDTGVLLRPAYQGAPMLSWTTGGSYVYKLPPKTFLNDLMDMYSMPAEFGSVIPSNAESAMTYWAALNMYLTCKFATW